MKIVKYTSQYKEELKRMMIALNNEDSEELPLTNEKIDSFFIQMSEDQDIAVYLIMEVEKVIGYVTLSYSFSTELGGRYVELEELYVKPEYRGRGFGKEAIQEVEQLAKENGAKSVFLVASSGNAKAQRLYIDLGYQKLPRIEYLKFI